MTKDEIIKFVIYDLEGGDKVINDTGGVTKYGIAQKFNPNVDVCNLNEARAIEVYDKKYWTLNELDAYPYPVNLILFDTAVNGGSVSGMKILWVSTHDWDKLIYARIKHYAKLCVGKTKYDPYFEGWIWRIIKLINKIEGEG